MSDISYKMSVSVVCSCCCHRSTALNRHNVGASFAWLVCRFDLRLKPIQRANLEILVDERKRNQSAVDDTSLRMKLVNLEKERKALDEPMAEIKVAKVDVQVQ